MRLPDFIIIGAAKSGTTTLYQYLCRHPQIFMSTPKEVDFFASNNDVNYAKGLNWYASLFVEAGTQQICGEATPKYTYWPHFPDAAIRIAQVLPQVKLIYIMRHPVERAYSHYVQFIKNHQNKQHNFKVPETFEKSIEKNTYILNISDYMKQIEQYLQFFPRESFLFLFLDDLIQNPAEVMRKVCGFVGIDEDFNFIQNNHIVANQAHSHTEWFLRSRITTPLRSIPGMTRIANLLPQSVRDGVYKGLRKLPYYEEYQRKQYVASPMRPKTRQMLLGRFQETNPKLAEFLHCDLSNWSK